jgi:hypothetical protein
VVKKEACLITFTCKRLIYGEKKDRSSPQHHCSLALSNKMGTSLTYNSKLDK